MAQINNDLAGLKNAASAAPKIAVQAVPSNGKELVIACVTISAIVASWDSIREGEIPPVRIAVGAGFLLVFLLFLADFEPNLAGGRAFLVLVSSLTATVSGPNFFDSIATASSTTTSTVKSAVYTGNSNIKSTIST